MYTVIDTWIVGKYTALELDKDLPTMAYKKYRIDGREYDPVPVYDLPRHIAIESHEDFKGKTVEFI